MRTIVGLFMANLVACGPSDAPATGSSQPVKSGAEAPRATQTATATATMTATAAKAAEPFDQSKPENVVAVMVEAAKNDDPASIAKWCDETVSKHRDVKMLCGFTKGDKGWEGGKGDMQSAKVASSKIEGDVAWVEFTYGQNGSKKETLELKKVGDKWFMVKM